MKLTLALVVALVLGVPAYTQESKPTTDAPKISAPLKVAAKQAFYFVWHEESRVNMTLPAEAGGQTQDVKNDSIFGLDVVVESVTEGKTTLSLTVASIKGSMTVDPVGTFEFDSSKPSAEDDGEIDEGDATDQAAVFEKVMGKMTKLVGMRFKAVFAADGALESMVEENAADVKDPIASAMRVGAAGDLVPQFKNVFSLRPSAPVAVGDVWEQPAPVALRGSKLTTKGQSKLQSADDAVLEVVHNAKIPATPNGADMQGLTIDVAEGSVKVSAKWSRKDGLPLAVTAESTIEGSAEIEQVNGEISMNMAAKFSFTRAERPAAPASRPAAESQPTK